MADAPGVFPFVDHAGRKFPKSPNAKARTPEPALKGRIEQTVGVPVGQ